MEFFALLPYFPIVCSRVVAVDKFFCYVSFKFYLAFLLLCCFPLL